MPSTSTLQAGLLRPPTISVLGTMCAQHLPQSEAQAKEAYGIAYR